MFSSQLFLLKRSENFYKLLKNTLEGLGTDMKNCIADNFDGTANTV